ncbi:hypothetical protein PR048_023388 [Dryococelus australis]|uniref:Uncharacterized protein n=1 Tax=Dryococelus australis TaxID=614101 RepID=A0ABQ9GU20_9NEOP|nr:hypothetical protein PR048_023388 [Dryococelus australis]
MPYHNEAIVQSTEVQIKSSYFLSGLLAWFSENLGALKTSEKVAGIFCWCTFWRGNCLLMICDSDIPCLGDFTKFLVNHSRISEFEAVHKPPPSK